MGIPKTKFSTRRSKINEYLVNIYQFDCLLLMHQSNCALKMLTIGNRCETWILTRALIEKLNIFARKCYRIKQSRDYVTNKSHY